MAKAFYIASFKTNAKNFVYFNMNLAQFAVVENGILKERVNDEYYGTLPYQDDALLCQKLSEFDKEDEYCSFYNKNKEQILSYIKNSISSIFLFLRPDELYIDELKGIYYQITQRDFDIDLFLDSAYVRDTIQVNITDMELLKAVAEYAKYHYFNWKLTL